jgi:hypothetical protein
MSAMANVQLAKNNAIRHLSLSILPLAAPERVLIEVDSKPAPFDVRKGCGTQ